MKTNHRSVIHGERDRQTERQTDREREKLISFELTGYELGRGDRQTDRQTDREIEIEREISWPLFRTPKLIYKNKS